MRAFTALLFGLVLRAALAYDFIDSPNSTTNGDLTFANNVRFLFDTDGNQIDAYAAKITRFDGTYYLYGVAHGEATTSMGQETLKTYSSNDLVNWKYEGVLCATSSSCGGGRPHILYSRSSGKYVLWTDNGMNGYLLSTSSSPKGPFTVSNTRALLDSVHGSLKPADFTIAEANGRGYAVYSMLNFIYKEGGSLWPPINQSMFISRLNADYTSTDQKAYPIKSDAFDLIDNEAESPDLFYRRGFYYVTASNTCGYCNGSIGLIYRAKDIEGPWTRQIISGNSCEGQVEGVLTLDNPAGGEPTFVWHSTSVPGGPRIAWGGHIFHPLEFNDDGSVKPLDCSPGVNFKAKFVPGKGPRVTGKAVSATNGSPAIANYHTVCDSDLFTLYQTWTSAKAGTLKEVSVNIAKAYQRMPLVVRVFKFTSYEDFVNPNYVYSDLATKMFMSSDPQLSLAFSSVIVSGMNAKVTNGEHLGISISGADFAPYCHLEYDTKTFTSGIGGQAPGKLFLQGSGQNSWRGIDGKASPIYEKGGKAIKFHAIVE